MGLQIDQSGKIEDTAKDTVIAYSNGNQYSIVIPRKVKRQVQEFFRQVGLPQLFIYRLFSIGVYFVIRDLKIITKIEIDTEFQGKDLIIKEMILDLLFEKNRPGHDLSFTRIGNKPKVHYVANDVLNKKRKAGKVLTYEEIFKILKSRWAFKRMSFNPGRRSAPALVRTTITKKLKMSR